MPAFAKVFDPTFEDLEDPYRHYDADGEPLEDRLYLPVGFDPGKKHTEVVACTRSRVTIRSCGNARSRPPGSPKPSGSWRRCSTSPSRLPPCPCLCLKRPASTGGRCGISSFASACPRRPCLRSRSNICAARRRARRNRMPSMRFRWPSSSKMGRAMPRVFRPSPWKTGCTCPLASTPA